MEGGAAVPRWTPNLEDLGDVSNLGDLGQITLAVLTIDVIALALARFKNLGGASLNDWQDEFGLEAVIADVLIIVIGFLIARQIYSAQFAPVQGWSPFLFVALLVVVQLIHDVAFQYGVIRPVPKGANRMIDVFKAQADENGSMILGGDALLMIGSALVAMQSKSMRPDLAACLFIGAAQALPYLLNQRGPKPLPPPPPPPKKEVAAERQVASEFMLPRW